MNRTYTEEQKQFIRDHVAGRRFPELTTMFNDYFGTDYKETAIKSLVYRMGLGNGLNGVNIKELGKQYRFKKGHVPWNKGKPKSWVGGEETRFKKGHIPLNHRPVGSERINVYGYIELKIAEPNKWKLKHQVVWEEKYGPVPEGYVLTFADGDKLNISLDNLILISKAQNAVLNRHRLRYNDADLTKTGIVIADMRLKISEKKKGVK